MVIAAMLEIVLKQALPGRLPDRPEECHAANA
jgi:hypothetical protein